MGCGCGWGCCMGLPIASQSPDISAKAPKEVITNKNDIIIFICLPQLYVI